MAEITESELNKELASGNLRTLYVFVGDEKYLLRRAAQRVLKKAAEEGLAEFNRNEFPASAEIDAIADAAMALPLMAAHKCVSVSDWDPDTKDGDALKKLEELLTTLPETVTLVFWYPTLPNDPRPSAKWRNFLKTAERVGAVVRFEERGVSDLYRLISREAERAGCKLDRRTGEKLIEYTGRDITRLLREMEKLCAYALGQGVQAITPGMIDELTYRSTETTVFLMSGALLSGNYEKAYACLGELFAQNEEPLSILGALSSAYLDMYRVQTALESGFPAAKAGEYGEYKGREFRLRNAERNLKGLRPEALRESLLLLLDADSALKGSRLPPRTVLEALIARMLLAAKGEKNP